MTSPDSPADPRERRTMRVFRRTAPSTLELGDAPAPGIDDLEPGEVLVRVRTAGICGSDLPYFLGLPSPTVLAGAPGVPVHEIAGEVVASTDPHLVPGRTVVGWAKGQNGLAEYVVTAAASLHAVAPGLDAGTAIMLQPLACVLHAVGRRGDLRGARVAVLGLGPIGALFAHVIAGRGASHVVGVDRVDRSDIARSFGVDEFVHADASAWANDLEDADRPGLIVEAIGHQVETLTAAVNAVAPEGEVFYFGIPNDDVYPLPMTTMLRKNLTLASGHTPLQHRRSALAAAEAHLERFPGLPGRYLTEPYEFARAQEAFRAAAHPRTGQLKVTIRV